MASKMAADNAEISHIVGFGSNLYCDIILYTIRAEESISIKKWKKKNNLQEKKTPLFYISANGSL